MSGPHRILISFLFLFSVLSLAEPGHEGTASPINIKIDRNRIREEIMDWDQFIHSALFSYNPKDTSESLKVSKVVPGKSADIIGLRDGDKIISIDGQKLPGAVATTRLFSALNSSGFKIEVLRNKKVQWIEVEIDGPPLVVKESPKKLTLDLIESPRPSEAGDFQISDDGTKVILKQGSQRVEYHVLDQCSPVGQPLIGERKIRHLEKKSQFVEVVYGKHCFAQILYSTGKIQCEGCD